MERKPELSPQAKDYLAVGRLLDAAGLSADGGEFELIEFVDAASEVIPALSDSPEYEMFIRAVLSDEYARLCRQGYSSDQVASYMLGSVLWRTFYGSDINETTETQRSQLDRIMGSIEQSEQLNDKGDKKLFYWAFANYTEHNLAFMSRAKKRQIIKLTRYTEELASRKHTISPAILPEATQARPSYRWYLIQGLASISMYQAYQILPYDEQEYEDGAWGPREHDARDELDE